MYQVQDNITLLMRSICGFLSDRLSETQPAVDGEVLYGNIASTQLGHTRSGATKALTDNVVVTLLRTVEDTSRRNGPRHRRVAPPPGAGTGGDGKQVQAGIVYQNPDTVLDLYLLITPNYTNYEKSLTRLSQVIAIFQHHNKITDLDTEWPTGWYRNRELKFTLQSPTIEEQNNICGMLDKKYLLPSALYHVQAANIALLPDNLEVGPPITEISLTETLR